LANWLGVGLRVGNVSEVCALQGGRSVTAPTPPPLVTTREALAEALSWTSGEMTRWSESAHPDHNRWSWRGDGHDEARREEFRAQADALLQIGVLVTTREALARALCARFSINRGLPLGEWERQTEPQRTRWRTEADALLALGCSA
jgi:hypothetical protein